MPVAVIEGGSLYLVRTDHIGRPVFATTTTGAQVWSASYLPFGGVRTATGALPTTRFPGQWFQSESGLHQNWMRDYDPTTGRYIQADPLGLVDGASVYGYVRQNPGRFIDPRGEYLVGGVVGGILADILFPDPTDLVPHKWLGYAGALALAWIVDSVIDDSAEPDDASATPQQCTADDDCRSARNHCIDHCSAKWLANTKGPVTRRSDKFSRCVAQCLFDKNCGGINHRPWFNYYP